MKKSFDKEKLHKVYMEIWKERGAFSQISGRPLGSEPSSLMFDHLLEKYKYPDLIYTKWNIILCTPDEHELKTNGFPLEKHKKLIEKAKLRYENRTDRSPP